MPIYEYECSQCGRIEEALQKFSDKPLTTCQQCAGRLTRLISQSTFHLKGSGWYVTDYAGKSGSSSTSSGANTQTAAQTDSSPQSADATATTTAAGSPKASPKSGHSKTSSD
jgi:putative FmdB family regulatory protein